MRKLLFISAALPWPKNSGGKLRDASNIKALSDSFEITLLTYQDGLMSPALDLTTFGVHHAYCLPTPLRFSQSVLHSQISTLAGRSGSQYTPGLVKRLASRLQHLARNNSPAWVHSYSSPQMQRWIGKLTSENSFDVIFFSHGFLAHFIDALDCRNDPILILDHHNVKTLLFRESARTVAHENERDSFRAEADRWERYYERNLNLFDLHFTTSEGDSKELAKLTHKPVFTVRTVLDAGEYPFRKQAVSEESLVFTGTLTYYPNVEAVEVFCRRILPSIQKRVPGTFLRVVGRDPEQYLQQLLKAHDDVECFFNVIDARPYTLASRAFVVPILNGSGTRLKILESMFLGVPVVTTSKGCEGLELVNGVDCLIADDEEYFAEAASEVLRDDATARKLARNGRMRAESDFSISSVRRHLAEIRELMH